MLISFFSSFILIESLGSNAVLVYEVSISLVFHSFLDELLSVSILLGLNYFIGDLGKILIRKVFHAHKTIFLKVYSAKCVLSK